MIHGRLPLIPLLIATLFLACVGSALQAQNLLPSEEPTKDSPASESTEELTLEIVENNRKELESQINTAISAATESTARQLGVSVGDLNDRVERLRALDGIYQQQVGALQRLEELQSSRIDLDQDISDFQERGFEQSPPYNIAFTDRLNDEVVVERRHVESLQEALATASTDIQNTQERLRAAERDRRAIVESSKTNTDPSKTARLNWQVNRARLEENFFAETLKSRRLRKKITQEELEIRNDRLVLLETKANAALNQTYFLKAELEEFLAESAKNRDAVERALPKLRDTHQSNEALRREARESLQDTRGDEGIAIRTEALASRTAWVDTAARAVEMAEKKLLLYDHNRTLLEHRYAVWQGADDLEYEEWKSEVQSLLEEWRRDRQIQGARLLDLRANQIDLQNRISEMSGDSEIRSHAENRLSALQAREEVLLEFLSTLIPFERLAERIIEDIERESGIVTWGERWQRFSGFIGAIWNFEIIPYEDGSITVRKIVIAVLILTIGMLIANHVTRALRYRLLARTPLNENAAAAVEKIAYYLILVLILIYTLNFVNIPLTFFAIFGGAIAIAVGFGAQHLINNFISGFILMIERPIRIGDLVEFEGVYGHIQHVGARSTRLHTAENIHLLIPNSRLLENTVVNWTLSDEKLRTSVIVGVIYGSPTDVVVDLLREATETAKRVLDSPKPVVLFNDFGDNALIFEVHFWVRMRRIMDKRQAETEVRMNVDRLFRDSNLVIAFPQRDIHIDSVRPIEVSMVSKGSEEDSS